MTVKRILKLAKERLTELRDEEFDYVYDYCQKHGASPNITWLAMYEEELQELNDIIKKSDVHIEEE